MILFLYINQETMSKYIWRKINVWFGKESTRWTAVAPAIRAPKASLDFEDKSEKVIDESSIGVIEDSFDWHVVKQYAEGNFECNVYANLIWFILLNVFWEVASSSKSWAYEHKFTVDETNNHQSLTISLADDTQDRQFALAMINSLELNAEVWDFVKATSNFRSKKWASATLTPEYAEDYAMLAKHVQIFMADDLSGLDSATPIEATNFSLTINKNIEDVDILGSTEPADFCNTFFSVEGSLEMTWDNETYKQLYMDWAKKALRIQVVDTNNTIGTSANPTLTIDLSSVIMTEFAKTQDNNALVRQSINIKALYSMADASMITATLLNTKSSY